MAQVFFVTNLGYSEPIYNKNISSSYIANKSLRVPMGFGKENHDAGAAYRVIASMALQTIADGLRKGLDLKKIIDRSFGTEFKKQLKGPIEIRQHPSTQIIYISYEGIHLSLNTTGVIADSNEQEFSSIAGETAIIKPAVESALTANQQLYKAVAKTGKSFVAFKFVGTQTAPAKFFIEALGIDPDHAMVTELRDGYAETLVEDPVVIKAVEGIFDIRSAGRSRVTVISWDGYPIGLRCGRNSFINLIPGLAGTYAEFETSPVISMLKDKWDYMGIDLDIEEFGYAETKEISWNYIGKWGIDYLPVFPGIYLPGYSYTDGLISSVMEKTKTGERGLDLGCGSGIISVALAKEMGVSLLAADIQLFSVANTKASAAACGVSHLIEAKQSDGFKGIAGRFDFIVSNAPVPIGDEDVGFVLEGQAGSGVANVVDMNGMFLEEILGNFNRFLNGGGRLYLMSLFPLPRLTEAKLKKHQSEIKTDVILKDEENEFQILEIKPATGPRAKPGYNRTSGTHSVQQMGKGLEVSRIFERDNKKIAEVVTAGQGPLTLGEIELADRLDSRILTRTMSYLTEHADVSYRPLLEAFLELLQTSPPIAFYAYSKLIKNLFGFARPQYNLIALHRAVSDNPLAIFHEICEYLIKPEDLKLEDNKLIISMNGKKFTITLKPESLAIARKDAGNPHYLLRAMQREMFGTKDAELTGKIKSAQRIRMPADKGWISRPEYLEWLNKSKNKVRELAGSEGLIAYYYAIGGGLVRKPGIGAEDIDIVSPLLATDFTLLIGSDIARGELDIFKLKVKKDLSSLEDVDPDSIVFGQGIEKIGENNYTFFTAEFTYLNKPRKIKVYYGMDAKRVYPDELRKGYNVLYSRGNPGLTLDMPRPVMSGLVSHLIKTAGFIIMENTPAARLSFKGFNLVDLGDISWARRRLDFYTNIKEGNKDSGNSRWKWLPQKLFVITLVTLLLSACSPDPTFIPMLLKDISVVAGYLLLLTGVGAGTIAFLALHNKTVNFKSIGLATISTAFILVSIAILLTNYPLSHFAEKTPETAPQEQAAWVTQTPFATVTSPTITPFPSATSVPQEQGLALSMHGGKVVDNKQELIDIILATNKATGVSRFYITTTWIQPKQGKAPTTILINPVSRETISGMLADMPETGFNIRATLEQGPYDQFIRITEIPEASLFSSPDSLAGQFIPTQAARTGI